MSDQKRKIRIIPILVFVVFIAAVAFLVSSIPYIRFKEESHVLEKGVEYLPEELIVKANGTITPQDELIYTKEVGKFEFHYLVKKLFFEKDVVLVYEVVDTTPPVISFKEDIVEKDPHEEYSDKQIRDNIVINEGSFTYYTDYDSAMSGPYTINVNAVDDYGNAADASFIVNVKDLEAPVVFVTGDGAMIYTDSDFDIMDIISYGDNVDPEPVLKVEGEVDTSKPGFYTLNAEVTDSSMNSTSWELTVEVADEFPEYEPSDYFYPFEDFISDYARNNRVFGIDVSSWQGDIDFEKVRDAGCEFVIIRIGFSYQGKFTLDNRFTANFKKAREAGLKVGIYHFSYDNNEEEVLLALDEIFAQLNGEKLDLPIVFDWEDFTDFNEYKMSFRQLNHLYDVFSEQVHKHGYQCMLYGSQYYLNKVWAHTDKRPIWLAQYNTRPTYEGQFEIWQLDDRGRIDGIEGDVDLDILFLYQ